MIVGFGARHAAVRRLAKALKARNVRFLPYQPRDVLSEALSAADVHYLGLARGLAGYVVPSRLNGILSAGRPVIVAADSESEPAQVVNTAECGITVPPGDSVALAAAIRSAYAGELDLATMGANGRRWVVLHRRKEAAIRAYRDLVADLLGNRGQARNDQEVRPAGRREPRFAGGDRRLEHAALPARPRLRRG